MVVLLDESSSSSGALRLRPRVSRGSWNRRLGEYSVRASERSDAEEAEAEADQKGAAEAGGVCWLRKPWGRPGPALGMLSRVIGARRRVCWWMVVVGTGAGHGTAECEPRRTRLLGMRASGWAGDVACWDAGAITGADNRASARTTRAVTRRR